MSWLLLRTTLAPLSSFSLLVMLSGSLAVSACAKSDSENAESQARTVAPIPPAEAERAKKACDSYVARVCQCATEHSDMEKECELAKGVPQALQLNLDVAGAQGLTTLQQHAMKATARQISDNCFSNDSKLDLQKCPRPDNASPKGPDNTSPP